MIDNIIFSKGIVEAVLNKYNLSYTDSEIAGISNQICNGTYRHGKAGNLLRLLANESWLRLEPPMVVSAEHLLTMVECSAGYILDLKNCLTNINRDLLFDKSSRIESLLSELYKPPNERFEEDGFINFKLRDIDSEMLCICDCYLRSGRYALLLSPDADEILDMFTDRLKRTGFSTDILVLRRTYGQNISC